LHRLSLVRCPDCPPARAARELVLSDGVWQNALYALLPFLVVALIALWFVRRLDGRAP
jgi:hypothetical protein